MVSGFREPDIRDSLRRSVLLTERLVSIPSVTPGEQEIIAFLEGWCHEHGLQVARQPVADGRDNLLAWSGQAPRLWFSTHVDTVPPFIPFSRQDDVLSGRGTCDTHGGLACMLTVLEELLAEGVSAGVLLVVGEEVNHAGARRAGEADPLPPVTGTRSIILCEPTEMKLVRAQKGVLKLWLRAEGRAAHSSLPHLGESAIATLLDCSRSLLEENWPTDPVLGPTFVNLGRISGGVAANVIPAEAEGEFCFRTVREMAWYQARILALVAGRCRVEFEGAGEPQVFSELPGWPLCVAPFGTDAEYLRPLGDVYLIGPGRIEMAHRSDESITLDELQAGLAGYRQLARQLLETH